MSRLPRYLFSVDVEEPFPDQRSGAGLEALIGDYLDFLKRHGAGGTFFIVGEVARRYPRLVAEIRRQGHEIACHSDTHIPIAALGRAAFRDDLRRNRDALLAAGAARLDGYRAPCFSLTERTQWAYAILAEEGFTYSSSVLPARNPLHGWPGFGSAPRAIAGVVELPVSLLPWRVAPFPAAGGVYFRLLPWPMLRHGLRILAARETPVLGYLHPYDIDRRQERLPFPGFSRWSPYNLLLHANRSAVLPRLERLIRLGFTIGSYGEHAAALKALAAPPEPCPE